jgi:hypothetical protein
MVHCAPLLEIVVTHAYFADGHCRGLRFTPTLDTAAWLRRVGGVCRDTGSGLLVLGDPSHLGLAAASPVRLCWTLRCEDARFAAVTEGLGLPGKELMLLCVPAEAGAAAEQWLHTGAHAGAADLWPLVWPAVSSQLGPAERRRHPLALVQVPAPHADGAARPPTRYAIRFAARAPVWKYCFVGHWSDDALEVVASNGALSGARRASPFGRPKAETLPDGRPVLAFLSTQGIELRERPERRFELRSAADQRVLLERLPVAGSDHFAFEPIGDERELVSEIYVHR